ncbi:MAG: flippase-like domain-containing protein [Chloroflexi bacterium]|nr:flippase-like domain-containing protein [Chloroflexota bacterium]
MLRKGLWFRLLISAVLIGLLLWRIELGEALDVLRDADYAYLALALPLYSLSKVVDAYRWRLMLRQLGSPPVLGLFGIYLMANMANNLFPVRIGDIIRVQVPARRYGLARAGLTATVFVTESLLDGVAFVILLLVALAFLDVPRLPLALVLALIVLVAIGLALAVPFARLRLTEGWQDRGWFARLPGRIREAAAGPLPEFLDGLALLRDVPLAARALTATFAAWMLESTVFYLFGLTFGLDLGFADYVVVMIAANMIVSMPVAPSNVGPYEVAVAAMLVLLGVDSGEAGAYALGTHLLNIGWVGISGLLAMWLMDLGLRDLFYLGRRLAEEEQPAP